MKKMSIFILTIVVAAYSSLAFAFENITYEVNTIKAYYNQGLYIEAMQLCEKTLNSRDISDADKDILTNYYNMSDKAYNDYLFWLSVPTFDNITTEVNQIKSYIKKGLYIEAMNLCKKTLVVYSSLSPEDNTILDNLYDIAETKYKEYQRRSPSIETARNSVKRISGYPYASLLAENNEYWYFAPNGWSDYADMRSSGGYVSTATIVYQVSKSTGVVTRAQ